MNPDLTWLALGFAALVVGCAKTSIGGLACISIAIYATILPARKSTGALLLVLVVGDVVAVCRYHQHADWGLVRSLLPAVSPGILAGALVLGMVGDTTLKRFIGVTLISLLVVQLALRRYPEVGTQGRAAGHAAGAAAGFATMTANAAGPVMTVFLVLRGVDKLRFIGTSGWFFLIINLCKVPLTASLGLFRPQTFAQAVALLPLVVLGGWLGSALVRRRDQDRFEGAVILASALSVGPLLIG